MASRRQDSSSSSQLDSENSHSNERIQQEHIQYARKLKKDQSKFLKQHRDKNESLQYLLKQAEHYTNFLFYGENKANGPQAHTQRSARKRIKDSLDDQNIIEEMTHSTRLSRLTVQPSLLRNGQLRPYQIDGVNWMISLYKAGINGILADEMGLGKTIQTIALLAYLREQEYITGPVLIVCPKTMIGNWHKEFEKWCPIIRSVKLIAAKPYREEIIRNELIPGKFDVCITSYEGIDLCHTTLRKFQWKYLIIDEAHKIKNDESNLSQLVRRLHSANRLLITGTPLQNNLHELWSLLNFILPDLFSSSQYFDEWFNLGGNEGMTEDEIENQTVRMVQMLHKILKPFILRRTKSEVERGIPPKREILCTVGMSPMQRDLYKKILTNELCRTDNKSHYLNIVMQLRKVCNHPYLFPSVEDETLEDFGDHIVYNSGKMKLLDKLLLKLRYENSQVLIFSQMTTMLDILEDYCCYREFKFCRLDGTTDIYERERMIYKFCKPNSSYFVFLLSTRAGGLGINLTSANTVIIFDSDWNPQMDLQAMDRAHRIGQTQQVNVYRLVTKDSLEERIIERQCLRLKLDSLIIQQGRLAPKHKPLEKEELQEMLHYGADAIFNAVDDDYEITDEDLLTIMQQGEEKAMKINEEMENQINIKKMNLVDFDSKIDMWNFESVDYSQKRRDESKEVIERAIYDKMMEENKIRRERKQLANYNIDKRLNILQGNTPKPKEFKPAPDFRFYQNRERLIELQRNEFNKEITDEEREELQVLLKTGYDWSRKEYQAFLKGCELYGKEAYDMISKLVDRPIEQVQEYSNIFWSRIDELQDKDRILKNIERRENLAEKHRHSQQVLDKKFNSYKNPWRELTFDSSSSHKSKIFTFDNDRFLVCMAKEVGYGNWDAIKIRIRKSQQFMFDYMLRSRTSGELQRRIDSLIRIIEKEDDDKSQNVNQPQKRKRANDAAITSPRKQVKNSEGSQQLNTYNFKQSHLRAVPSYRLEVSGLSFSRASIVGADYREIFESYLLSFRGGLPCISLESCKEAQLEFRKTSSSRFLYKT